MTRRVHQDRMLINRFNLFIRVESDNVEEVENNYDIVWYAYKHIQILHQRHVDAIFMMSKCFILFIYQDIHKYILHI